MAGWRDIAQLLSAIAIFIIVLLITFLSTRFVGGYAKQKLQSGNIEVLETCRLSPGKFVQLVRIGDKYFALSVSKDRVDLITELPGDSLTFKPPAEKSGATFQDLFDKAKNRIFHRGDKNDGK
ncbi:MAG: flagellar biosynthetic protein FliO [Lachnospiraceae bacterium]|nr:flagellar biosynthetic protein FliO [Lachnospiraceae bacterium]